MAVKNKMNLVLAYEMGIAMLAAEAPGSDPHVCWKRALSRLRASPGLDLQRTVERVEKGAFPDGLGRLRGQVHAYTAGATSAVAIVIECGPQTVVLVSNSRAALHGFWHVEAAEFYSFAQDELHATTPAFLKRVSSAASAATWVAYWVKPLAEPPVPTSVQNPVPVPAERVEEQAASAAAAPAPTKKKVIRKRTAPAAPPPSAAATEETTEATVVKKQAVAVAASEEESGAGAPIE